MKKKETIEWINCAKFIAIFAVIIDHTNGVLYSNPEIALLSYFSVSLFILISGMMSFESNERHELGWWQTFLRSSKRIIIAYMVANAIYLVWVTHGFEAKSYFQYVFGFNMSGPFYYVLLYLQLMLVNRCMYNAIKRLPSKLCGVYEGVIGLIILLFCSWTTRCTNLFDVYGGVVNCWEEPICSCFIWEC